jgi:hypothetical protein
MGLTGLCAHIIMYLAMRIIEPPIYHGVSLFLIPCKESVGNIAWPADNPSGKSVSMHAVL